MKERGGISFCSQLFARVNLPILSAGARCTQTNLSSSVYSRKSWNVGLY